ncbi:MAG: hypothetical protein HZC16_01230 [Candidatus Omnitrophica bacterium]|nr:hypothetical protein [Candidatus Omnitrophota bacterium]
MMRNLMLMFLILSMVTTVFAQEEILSVSQPDAQNKISLDIKGMDIVDVLKILADRAALNLVIGKNVTGRVTLFLKDVDINDAFEIILLANELACERKGKIINVMTQRDYELIYGDRYKDAKQAKIVQLKYAKAAELSRALNQIKTNVGRIVVDEGSNTLVLIDTLEKLNEMLEFIKNTDLPLQTRVFSLSYAQAEKIQPKIQETLTKGIGYIRIDERTNKIAVTDYPEKLDEIARIISAFDEKTPQVLIDAQIIEIKPKDTFKMGVDWDYWLEKNVRLLGSLPNSSGTNILKIGMAAKNTATLDEQGQYKGVIDMLRTIGDTQILSSPRIAVVNNQEAKILIGTKQVYVSQTTSQSGTGTEVTADQVNFVDVGIKLYVTPTINREGFITMKIKPEISSVKENYTYGSPAKTIPIVETSETETTVMVKDGVTIIIGGLKKDKKEKSVEKIPIIGDIPLLGLLFRRTSDSFEKTELVILLTPHILTGDTAITGNLPEVAPKDGAIASMDKKGNIILKKIESPKEKAPQQEATFLYYDLLNQKIKQSAKLNPPEAGLKGKVGLSFTLSCDGSLIGDPKVTESTDSSLVLSALKTLKDALPFPAFPKDLQEPEETFYITIDYR